MTGPALFGEKKSSDSPTKNKGIQSLIDYPPGELYRLFVDGCLTQQYNGWKGYEDNEKGSLSAVFKGFTYALENLSDLPNLDLIRKIHELVATGVKLGIKEVKPGEFRQFFVPRFHIPNSDISEDGLLELFRISREFLTELTDKDGNISLKIETVHNSVDRVERKEIRYVPLMGEGESFSKDDANKAQEIRKSNYVDINFEGTNGGKDLENLMNKYTTQYHQEISEAKDDDEKIKTIVRYIKRCELLHPFVDCNTRLFVNILLNCLLIKNNLPIATFEQPSMFYAFSEAELVGKIKEAMENTRKIIAGKQLFNFDTKTMSEKDKESLSEITAAFDKVRQELGKGITYKSGKGIAH